MAKEKSYRKHRFKRDPGVGMRLEKRDINVLKLLYDNRLLNSGQIQIATPGSNQNILRRLRKLYDNGYLDCLETSVYEKKIFALGNKGADVISTYYGIDRGKIDWDKKNREVKNLFVNHTLMVADFRICLELAIRKQTQTGITFWISDGGFREYVNILKGGREVREPVNPDSYFGLQDLADPEREFLFFLEADRSTMDHQRILNKMRAYWRYYKMIKEGKKKGDFFRVLVITKTEARKENLRELTKEADDDKSGSAMYWFASEQSYSLENPQTILEPIWQTPKDDTFHCLLL